jgi:hypothetical protein
MQLEDLGKAFACASWNNKGKTFPLIESYLKERQQRVTLIDRYANHN